MPPRIRRAPLLDRIKANLDPYDFLLWLWEELNDDIYDEWIKIWATPIALGLNILFIIARGASRPSWSSGADDVFGDLDGRKGSGWIAWFVSSRAQCRWYIRCHADGSIRRRPSLATLSQFCAASMHTTRSRRSDITACSSRALTSRQQHHRHIVCV
jgi:hypothetical protein